LSRVDANGRVPGKGTFDLRVDGTFTGIAGQLRVRAEGGSTLVEADTNGDANHDFTVVCPGDVALNFLL